MARGYGVGCVVHEYSEDRLRRSGGAGRRQSQGPFDGGR
jgi:hypothetical protein